MQHSNIVHNIYLISVEKEWTIIFLIYADFHIDGADKLKRELSALFGHIISASLNRKNELLVIYNRLRSDSPDKQVVTDDTYILRAVIQETGISTLEEVFRYPAAQSLQEPDLLAFLFNHIHNNKLLYRNEPFVTKASDYLLLTWGHGSVFGIFRRNRDAMQNGVSANPGDRKDEQGSSVRNKNEATSSAQIPGRQTRILNVLTNENLANAITKGFSGKPVSVLAMMNCYMMNIHTCYALQNKAKLFIAPQGGIDEPGYDYAAILDAVYRDDEPVTAHALADRIVRSCGAGSEGRLPYENRIERWSVFQTTNTGIGAIAERIDRLASFCLAITDRKARNILRDARALCIKSDINNANYYLIDFMHWIKTAIKHFILYYPVFDGIAFFRDTYEAITGEWSACMVQPGFIGKDIWNSRIPEGMVKDQPSGLGIYFPPEIDKEQDEFLYFVDPASPHQDLFLKEKNNWLRFLGMR